MQRLISIIKAYFCFNKLCFLPFKHGCYNLRYYQFKVQSVSKALFTTAKFDEGSISALIAAVAWWTVALTASCNL